MLEGIRLGQIREYISDYARQSGRSGRILAVELLPASPAAKPVSGLPSYAPRPRDLWKCVELNSGDAHNYTEEELLSYTEKIAIQTGQRWVWTPSAEGVLGDITYVIRLGGCTRIRTRIRPGYTWKFEDMDGHGGVVEERTLLHEYARLDPLSPTKGRVK